MSRPFKYCPRCARELVERDHDGVPRRGCPDDRCGFVHWNNPVPVVAAIVEHEGRVLLARNALWPQKMFGLITGFLEKDETPEAGVLREVQEEVGLTGRIAGFVGHYGFPQMNQLIIAFHVQAEGEVRLNAELAEYKRVEPANLRPWPTGTGLAVRDWLKARGLEPEMQLLSPLQAIPKFLALGENVGTAGQPAAEHFPLIAASGYSTVINLAPASSPQALPDEPKLVEQLGMDYVHIPVDFAAPTDEDLRRFFAAMDARAGKKVFVHCIANMRVSAFMFLYRVLRLGERVSEAEMALHRLWVPDGAWAAFIERSLRAPQPPQV